MVYRVGVGKITENIYQIFKLRHSKNIQPAVSSCHPLIQSMVFIAAGVEAKEDDSPVVMATEDARDTGAVATVARHGELHNTRLLSTSYTLEPPSS